MLSARTACWPSSQSCPQAQADCTLALSGKTAPVACRSRSARRGCARGLLRPEACSHLLPVAGDTCIRLERWACWLSGPARSRGGGGPSEKATSQPFLAQVISEAERVLNTSATKKDMQVVMRRFSSTLVAAGVVKF